VNRLARACLIVSAALPACARQPHTIVYAIRTATSGISELTVQEMDGGSGRLNLLQTVPGPVGPLDVDPSGEHLFVATRGQPFRVRTLIVGAGGLLTEATTAAPAMAGGTAIQMHAAPGMLYVRVDDTSTAYSAYVESYRFDAAAARLERQGTLASHGGHSSSVRLIDTAVDPTGRFLYELTTSAAGGAVTTWSVGPRGSTATGTTAIPGGPPMQVVVQPDGRWVHVLARAAMGRAVLHSFTVDGTGALRPVSTSELPGLFTSSSGHATVHPSGGVLYAPATGSMETVALDPATGGIIRSVHNVGAGPGIARVDPLGRFLYLSSPRVIRGFRIASDGLTLADLGPLGDGGGDFRVLTID
jgi:DNA-binding beta-propeller fold protein YncE